LLEGIDLSSLLAGISDIHSGSTVAICPPRFNLDEGTYTANKWQIWLWRRWLDYWDYVKVARGRGRKQKSLYVAILGEIGEGDHHGSLQNFVPKNVALQKRLAIEVLKPMFDLNPDYIFVFRGTEAHSGKSGQFDEMIAEDIGAEQHPVTEQYAWSQGLVEIDGVLFDLAHHGKTGNLKWTKLNGAYQYASTLSYHYLERYEKFKERVPDIALRGHKHTYVDTYKNARVRLIGLSGWKAADNFLHRIAKGDYPKYGGVVVDCNDGKYEVDDTLAEMEMPRDKVWKSPN
jgi:hypothetical protein